AFHVYLRACAADDRRLVNDTLVVRYGRHWLHPVGGWATWISAQAIDAMAERAPGCGGVLLGQTGVGDGHCWRRAYRHRGGVSASRGPTARVHLGGSGARALTDG